METPSETATPAGPRSCPLCDERRVPDDSYAELFAIYGAAGARRLRTLGAPKVAERLDLLGGPVAPEVIWAHFAQHDRRQPRPPGNLKRGKTLAATGRLSDRQREVLRLVARLGVVSAQHIWQALYEDQLATANAARSTCYRELHPLIYGHYLYRARAPRPRGLALRDDARIETLTFLHPGRQLIPMVEEEDGYTPMVVTDARDIDEHRLRLVHAANGVALSLRRELYTTAPDLGAPADLRINPENWFGSAQTKIPLTGQGRGIRARIAPDGLAALSVLVPSRGVDVLLPFFYLRDPGYQPVPELIEELLGYGGLALGGDVERRFPDLGRHVPPLLLVCDTARRLQAIGEAFASRIRGMAPLERPVVLASDRTSAGGRSFSAQVWTPLAGASDAQARVSLLRALLQSSASDATREGLRAATRLRAALPRPASA